MTKDEALKMALLALEHSVATCFYQYAHQQVMRQPDHFLNKAITDIKEALAQPEQEPVKDWIASHKEICALLRQAHDALALTCYPPQRKWVGLTDDEMMDAIYVDDTPMERGRRVEAKLRSKNTRGQE